MNERQFIEQYIQVAEAKLNNARTRLAGVQPDLAGIALELRVAGESVYAAAVRTEELSLKALKLAVEQGR